MAAISQIVDERIERLRKEKAELDQLRADLEKREADLSAREAESSPELAPLEERKAAIMKEIEAAQAEVNRLRSERLTSVENFGEEMEQIRTEKNAQSVAQSKQLQSEIAAMQRNRTELAEEIEELRRELEEITEKLKRDRAEALDDKEAFLARARAERESGLKEMNLAHSIAVADLEQKKKALEAEVAALETTQQIEWKKVEAEISRHRTKQLAELDVLKAEERAAAEKEGAKIISDARAEERRQAAELATARRNWEKELLQLNTKKQAIIDETKLLEFEYEKIKSENIVRLEKMQVDERKAAELARAEALAKLEEEHAALTVELRKQIVTQQNRHREEVTAAESEIAVLEGKKTALIRDIDQLSAKYDQQRAEDEASLEVLRSEKLKAIDEERVQKLSQIETQRQARVAALETTYLEKAAAIETTRAEKMAECRRDIEAIVAELEDLKVKRHQMTNDMETLRGEKEKIIEDNAATAKRAELDLQIKLEQLTNEKLAEIEAVYNFKASQAEAASKRLANENDQAQAQLLSKQEAIAHATEQLHNLRMQISSLESDLTRQKETKLTEMKKETIDAADEMSKLKLAKMSEIERSLEDYREERLANVQADIERQIRTNYRKLDELIALNDDYNRRMADLNELTLALEADKRDIDFKQNRYRSELAELRSLLKMEPQGQSEPLLTPAPD